MAVVAIEPQTSRILGNHLPDCAIADVMTSFALGWYDLQNIKVCPLNMIMNFCLV
jgi:hypothetical protein